MKKEEVFRINVEPGEFPFPIDDGPVESRYLTWVRNNANYMAVRGFLDYMRAIGVLLRGIVINFVVLLPFALMVSFAIAWWYQSADTYVITFRMLILAAAVVLLYPLLTPLWNIFRHRRRLETGSDSSVKPRSQLEQLFGILLLAILGVAAFESLAAVLEPFHKLVYESDIRWEGFLSMMAAALAIFASTDKLLSVLGGIARKLAMVTIGLLGVLVPLFFILLVSDYLVFNPPKWTDNVFLSTFLIPMIMILTTFIAGLMLLVGWLRSHFSKNPHVFTFKDVSKMFTLVVVLLLTFFFVFWYVDEVEIKNTKFETSVLSILEEARKGKEEQNQSQDVTRKSSNIQVEVNESKEDQDQGVTKKISGWVDERLPTWDVKKRVNQSDIDEDMQKLVADAGKKPYPPKLRQLFIRLEERSKNGHPELVPKDMSALARTVVDSPLKFDPGNELDGNALSDAFKSAYRELALKAIYSKENYPHLFNAPISKQIRKISFELNAILLLLFAVPLWLITRYTVDINLTSIHGLYRDRLASAFLVGADTKGDVDIEKDLDLVEICRHEAGSTAPYHLINVALNLQGSKAIGVRDRQSDFFVFSKKFIGGFRTGYCRGETMELFFPQMSLSTAMAISAAAASPNMGRATSPALVVIMTLFNIRLGYWLPNPSRLESWLYKQKGAGGKDGGYEFNDVFAEELYEIRRRWENMYKHEERYQSNEYEPTIKHALVGVGFSGGGIRSATINLGITQALHKRGVFNHIDYMSTVSGGGYLGSSISALMRQKIKTDSEVSGNVDISTDDNGRKLVSVTPSKSILSIVRDSEDDQQACHYEYASYANLAVKQGSKIRKGQRLLNPTEVVDAKNKSFSPYYRWRVRPSALLRELAGKLNETSKWVNVSDGGHIENLAGIELLRRRCKYIVIGDGEADPEHHFNGLAILLQTARIDLGIHIDIDVDPLRLNEKGLSKVHWVVGRIHYPDEIEKGYLLYLKSSITGDEDEVIKRYRNRHPTFPHESTADQSFGEGQFEAYRSLGQHIGESLFKTITEDDKPETTRRGIEQAEREATSSSSGFRMSFAEFEQWFETLASKHKMEDGPNENLINDSGDTPV